ncbi:Bug family tripartite tricarboxylate transporter substrate binding protein [Rhodoferax ferrireducens]|uniref:Bug family tripartite tricarboxylate transporter substrate binding protein n=1 Tax=Rhodoferax ferrireducens TaxID=192843 RepID=UPI000E0D4001|nr:tripartite tricarboxylate transporter substrate binding protein [Rhodoferax ferrireducens]
MTRTRIDSLGLFTLVCAVATNIARVAAAAVATTFLAQIALAETFPSKPLKIVVPYAAGGPVDQLARTLAEGLSRSLGQAVIVENKPGGNTMVAASQVAKAQPDGYTLFMASSASLAVNPVVYKKMAYDPDRDFTPVSMVARAPLVMVVNAGVPAKNLKELTAYIKSMNGRFAFASNGNGNPLHLACALFSSMANLDMLHVPYNGTAPALASVLAGDTQMTCDIVQNSIPQIKSHKLRAIAIIGPRRVAVLPDVPTLGEEGLLGVDASVWFAVVVPKNTPLPRVDLLNQHIAKVLATTELRERFGALAMEVQSSSGKDVTNLITKERSKWMDVVTKYKISID